MAVQKFTSCWFAPGVTVAETGWGFIFEGTAQDLIANEIIEQEWLPGHGNNGKTTQNVLVEEDKPRLINWGEAVRRKHVLSERQALIKINRHGRTRYSVSASTGGSAIAIRRFSQPRYNERLLSDEDLSRAIASCDMRIREFGLRARAYQMLARSFKDFEDHALTDSSRDLMRSFLSGAAQRTSTSLSIVAPKRKRSKVCR